MRQSGCAAGYIPAHAVGRSITKVIPGILDVTVFPSTVEPEVLLVGLCWID